MTYLSISDPLPAHARLKISNAHIVDVRQGCFHPEGTHLWIRDGKIEAISQSDAKNPPFAADFIVDLQGKSLLPGFFNTHCHLQLKYPGMFLSPADFGPMGRYTKAQIQKSLADCWQRGILHLRDAYSGDLRPNRLLKEQISQGKMTGPRIYQSVMVCAIGGVYARKPTLFSRFSSLAFGTQELDPKDPYSGVIAVPPDASEQMLRDAVDRAIDERGAQAVKFYDQTEVIPNYQTGAINLSDAQITAAADQARRRGIPSTLHHVTRDSFRRAVNAGVTTLAHLPKDALLDEQDARALISSGCKLEATTSLLYYLSFPLPDQPTNALSRLERLSDLRQNTYPDLIRQYWLPNLQPSAARHFLKAQKGEYTAMRLMDMRPALRYWAPLLSTGIDNLRLLVQQGARVVCGTDAGATAALEAMIQLELNMLDLFLNEEQVLFSAAERLRCASLYSARALGVEDQFGSLEPGKVADLVVLDGDPFKNPQLIGAPASALFVEGQLQLNHCELAIQAQPPAD